ncbi:unnamed protein product [Cuscuta campestris]|uniref:DNA-directed RNA polymerase III subunit n=1 Tax=Cuscuta campestris TaxID=132261 RepID=A0A484LP67_9ASTE|nr:unnamed protein product [Cuscuta campestris]
MAFRGRGRGRGGYGGGFKRAKEEPFELFPAIDDETLGKETMVFPDQEYAARAYPKILKHFRSSPYYIRDETGGGPNETKIADIERFSDMDSNRSREKSELSDFITISAALYPAETAKRRTMMIRRAKKRVRWSQDADLQDLDFERFERDSDGEDGKKNGSEDDEDDEEEDGEENAEEDEDSFDEDDDYMKNEDFDDDEDDFNMDDDANDDEGTYD